MVSSKFVGILILGLSLAACSVENRRGKDYMLGRTSTDSNFVPTQGQDFAAQSGTNFRVDSVSVVGSTLASRREGGVYSIGVPKKKQFTFSACLKDSGGAALLPNLPFQVLDGSQGVISTPTDVNGCITWTENQEYVHATDEAFFKLKRTVQAGKPYRGSVYVVVGFDPWAKDAGAIRDLRKNALPPGSNLVDVGSVSLKGQGGLMAQAVSAPLAANIQSMAFEFRALDYDNYSIDSNLNLTVAHKYQIRVTPTYLRRSFEDVVIPEPFRGGCMKTYFAIFRERKNVVDQYQLKDLVSWSEFNICDQTEVGLYLADVSLKFPNIVDLSSRTLALVSFSPTENIPGLGEMAFYGVLKPGRAGSLTLSPSKISARDLVEKAKEQASVRATQSPVSLFATHAGYDAMDFKPVTVPGGIFRAERTIQPAALVQASFNGPLSSDQARDLEQVLCQQLYGSASASLLHSCQAKPSDFVAYGRRDFADKVLSRPIKINREPIVDSLSMSIAYSSSVSDSSKVGGKLEASAGLSGSLGLGISLPSIDGIPTWVKPVADLGLKLSAGGSVYASRGLEASWGSTTSISQKSDVNVQSEGHTFKFDAEVRPCFIATRKTPGWATSQVGELAKANTGVYSCATGTRKETRAETYYLLSQNVGTANSTFTDSDSADEVSWRMFIRGTALKSLIFDTVKASKAWLVLEEIPADEIRTELLGAVSTTQEFPGVLSPAATR